MKYYNPEFVLRQNIESPQDTDVYARLSDASNVGELLCISQEDNLLISFPSEDTALGDNKKV